MLQAAISVCDLVFGGTLQAAPFPVQGAFPLASDSSVGGGQGLLLPHFTLAQSGEFAVRWGRGDDPASRHLN